MSVVIPRKVGQAAGFTAALLLICGLAACSRSKDTQAESHPAEPAAASAPAEPATEAPLGESTRSAEAAAPVEPAAPVGNSVMQTAEAAPPSVVKAATVDTTAADDTDKSASSLSAEQQELAAEVGDTRHAAASAGDKGSDKAPD